MCIVPQIVHSRTVFCAQECGQSVCQLRQEVP